jgi:transposase-like protein
LSGLEGAGEKRASARRNRAPLPPYISYGGTALVLEAIGAPLGKTTIYEAVQAAGARVAGLRREQLQLSPGQLLVAVLGADTTTVKVKGQWVTVGVMSDILEGTTVTVDLLPDAQADTLSEWVGEVAQAVGAQVLVSDDADTFKTAADEQGLAHQVCKSHVLRNTEAWVEDIKPELEKDADGSLADLGVSPEQAVADVDALLQLMQERQPTPEAAEQLQKIHQRYQAAPSPKTQGTAKMSLAYRLRLFSLDRWNLWPRLTLYRRWADEQDRRMDGTNNATERAIGWRVKERYRTMRGYKRPASVLNVSRLIAWAGDLLHKGGADLAAVVA